MSSTAAVKPRLRDIVVMNARYPRVMSADAAPPSGGNGESRTPQQPVSIVTAAAQQHPAAARILAAAFIDDPVMRVFIPEGVDREHRLALLFLAMMRDPATDNQIDLARDADGRILGAAMWERPLDEGFRAGFSLVPLGMMIKALGIAQVPNAARTQRRLAKHRPGMRHWYLGEIGVGEQGRGRGIGTALLQHGLARADRDDEAVYLESSTPRNRALYRRSGFIELAPITGIGEARPAAMWRPAASTPRG